MKAIALIQLPSPGQVAGALDMVQVPVPTPSSHEVVIRSQAAAIHIDEIYAAQGTALGRFYGPKTASREQPHVLGTACTGIVTATGDDVVGFEVGDEVIVVPDHHPEAGGWAEFRCIPEKRLMMKPANLTHVEAAAITMAACVAWGAVEYSQPKPGDRTVVVGASGSIGIMALQFLKSSGCHVTAICSGKNAELARRYGADDVVDYTRQNFAQIAGSAGIKYDSVIDCIGGRDIERDGVRALHASGRYITVVGPMQYIGERKLSWYELSGVFAHVLRKIFVSLLKGPRYIFGERRPALSIHNAMKTIVSKNLSMPVERVIPFELSAVRDAIQLLVSHRARGRIVIDFEQNRSTPPGEVQDNPESVG